MITLYANEGSPCLHCMLMREAPVLSMCRHSNEGNLLLSMCSGSNLTGLIDNYDSYLTQTEKQTPCRNTLWPAFGIHSVVLPIFVWTQWVPINLRTEHMLSPQKIKSNQYPQYSCSSALIIPNTNKAMIIWHTESNVLLSKSILTNFLITCFL